MKKMISLLLAVCTILGSMTANVFAQETGKCGNEVTWTLDGNGLLTISGNGDMYDYNGVEPVIPDIAWQQDKMTPWYAFKDSIRKVAIESGVTKIGRTAFACCDNITEISIPEGVTRIGAWAFYECNSLEKIYLPDSTESFGQGAFGAEGIKTVSVPKMIKSFGVDGFDKNCVIEYRGTEAEWDNLYAELSKSIDMSIWDENIIICTGNEGNSSEEELASAYILINNKILKCDQPPVIKDDRTLVPMRAIFEALGAEVSWDENTKTATGTKDGKDVSVTISENSININGEKKEIDVPAQIIGGRTMVPVRAISEAFDCSVQWNGLKKCVIIIPKNQTPYKIDVLTNGEIIATAHFNESGLLTKITHDTDKSSEAEFALLPLYLNMNANAYFNIFWASVFYRSTGEIDFAYENDRLASVAYENRTLTYSYNEDNTVKNIISSIDKSFNYSKYFDYSMYPIVKCREEIYTFNDDGLLSETDMHQSGGRNSFSYNNCNLIGCSASYYTMSYNYDSQRLTTARHRDGGGKPTDFVYQYSNE